MSLATDVPMRNRYVFILIVIGVLNFYRNKSLCLYGSGALTEDMHVITSIAMLVSAKIQHVFMPPALNALANLKDIYFPKYYVLKMFSIHKREGAENKNAINLELLCRGQTHSIDDDKRKHDFEEP